MSALLANINLPRLNRGMRVLRRSDGSIAVGRSLRFVNFSGSGVPVIEWLIRRSDGKTPTRDLLEEARVVFPDFSPVEVSSLWEKVIEADLVHDAEPADQLLLNEYSRERFDRQLGFWIQYERTSGLSRYQMQRNMQEAKVLQIGFGGLGSWIAYGLASTGIGELIGVDPDTVELSNLNRQILYGAPDVGRSKIAAAKERLTSYYPELKFVAHDGLADSEERIAALLNGVDFAILSADHPQGYLRRWFARACLKARVPHIMIGGSLLGPLVVPGESACFGCYEQHLRAADPDYDAFIDQLNGAQPEHASVAFNHSVVAGYIVRESSLFIAGAARPASRDAIFRLNLDEFTSRRFDLRRDPACPLCHDISG